MLPGHKLDSSPGILGGCWPQSFVSWSLDYFKETVYLKILIECIWGNEGVCICVRGVDTIQSLLSHKKIKWATFRNLHDHLLHKNLIRSQGIT